MLRRKAWEFESPHPHQIRLRPAIVTRPTAPSGKGANHLHLQAMNKQASGR